MTLSSSPVRTVVGTTSVAVSPSVYYRSSRTVELAPPQYVQCEDLPIAPALV
jgi:hypothetical protein